MELEKISTAVRPRNKWEAIDLGFLMARHWFFPLLKAWISITLPLFIILLSTVFIYPWLPILVIWWLKPIWERTQLHIVSRALFSEIPTLRETLKAFPRIAARQWFQTLTFRRLNLSRSMDLPVDQLENLSEKGRFKRLKVLHGTKGSGAGWLMFICIHLEAVLPIAIVFFISMFIPSELDIEWFDMFFGSNLWNYIMWNTLAYCSMAIVAPFYVTAGFSLYINRRTWLEGWNIELAFRRILQRVRPNQNFANLAIIIVVTTLTLSPTDSVSAAEEQLNTTDAKEKIETILEGKEFHNKKTIRTLDYDFVWGEESESPSQISPTFKSFAEWVSANLRLLLWIIFISLLLILVYNYRHWFKELSHQIGSKDNSSDDDVPSLLFGMNVDKESLPDDILGQVNDLWNKQQFRAAYSLLYRATLQQLMEQHHIKFREGYTEEECKRIVQKNVAPELGVFFSDITLHWQRLAYAHQILNTETMEELCQRWPLFFKHGVNNGNA